MITVWWPTFPMQVVLVLVRNRAVIDNMCIRIAEGAATVNYLSNENDLYVLVAPFSRIRYAHHNTSTRAWNVIDGTSCLQCRACLKYTSHLHIR